MRDLQTLLDQSSARHSHLCPRQVLGIRVALAGIEALNLTVPRSDKRLLAILETDGCFANGVEVASGCTVGHRTLRIEDYGKIAAIFVDIKRGCAMRVAPRVDVRERAYGHAPDERRHYFAQLHGYQIMPNEELLTVEEVYLTQPIAEIVSRPGVRVNCASCGEEIINEREVLVDDRPYCRHCAHGGYYQVAMPTALVKAQPMALNGNSQ